MKRLRNNGGLDEGWKGEHGEYEERAIESSTECTGMVPTPPLTDADAEAYSEITPMPQQAATGARRAEGPAQQKKKSSR